MAKTRKEDVDLDPQQWRSMNEAFYARDPTKYFSQRLNVLALVGCRRAQLADLLAEGVSIGKFTSRPTTAPASDETDDLADHEQPDFIADAVVLFHHTVESMLRMYLAHADGPNCPRLEIARMRTPGAFKTAVVGLIESVPDANTLRQVADVCYGLGPDRQMSRRGGEPLSALSEQELLLETWNWFVYLARMWLDEAALYNAAKHGFCIDASASAGFWLGGDDEDPGFAIEGAAIMYLDLDRETSEWVERRTFVDVPQIMALTFLANRMAGQIWACGRSHYTDFEAFSVADLGTPTVREFLERNQESHGRKTWSMSLLYLDDAPTFETVDGPEDAHPAPDGRYYRPRSVRLSIPVPQPWVITSDDG